MARRTRQKDAIRRVFSDSGRPLSPDEALELAQDLVPGMGIATVYRNVKRLWKTGWLTPVDLPGTGLRYELAEQPHHHHFVCRSCEQAFDVDACPPAVEDLAPGGFEVESHEIILYGRCRACAERPGSGAAGLSDGADPLPAGAGPRVERAKTGGAGEGRES